MIINISKQIEAAIAVTREWEAASGYVRPPCVVSEPLSKNGRNALRVLSVSDFGCQQRNVYALVGAILGESLPSPEVREAEYRTPKNPPVGVFAASVRGNADFVGRAGKVTRVSNKGNAEILYSFGGSSNTCYNLSHIRPADDEEIAAYFAEIYGISKNEADQQDAPVIGGEPEDGVPF